MLDVLLISEDPVLITEIQKICAVTQANLKHQIEVADSDLISAQTVLIDAQLDLNVKHANVVVVTLGEPGVTIWQKAVSTGAKYVAFLPDARPWLLENLLPKVINVGYTLGFIGSTGGLGTSLLASMSAIYLAEENKKVLLAEFSGYSGGLDVLWGIEGTKGTRWSDLSSEVLPNDLLRSLPTSAGVSILSSDQNTFPSSELVVDIATDIKSSVEYSVFDLPDITSPNFDKLLQLCDEVVFVVGSTIRSINAANQAIKNIPHLSSSKLVIRNLNGTNLAALSIAKTLNLKLQGELPTDVKIVEHLEQGISPSKISSSNYRKAVNEIFAQLELANVHFAA